MLDRLKKLAALCLGLSVVVLFARLVWIASRAETGWETGSIEIRDSTVGILTGPREPFQESHTDDAAEFFMNEVNRLVDRSPDSAETAMAGALILDSRPPWPISWHPKLSSSVQYFKQFDLDQEFEATCHERCLELAERATTLEPDNPLWWQLRAVLLLAPINISYTSESRMADWQAILDECAANDPGNGLYNLIAAHLYLSQSSKFKYQARDKHEMVIHDPVGFKKGNQHVAEFLGQPRFELGYEIYPLLLRQLDETRIRRADQHLVVYSRYTESRIWSMLRETSNTYIRHAETHRRQRNLDASIRVLRQYLELILRIQQGELTEYKVLATLEVVRSCTYIRRLVNQEPRLMSTAELDDIKVLEYQARMDSQIRIAISNRRRDDVTIEVDGMTFTAGQNPWKSAQTLAGKELPAIIVLLFVLAIVSWPPAFHVRDSDARPSGAMSASISFVFATFSVGVLLLIGPSDLITDSARSKLFLMVSIGLLVAVLIWLIAAKLRGANWQVSLRTYLAVVILVAAVAGMGLRAYSLLGSTPNLPTLDPFPTRGVRDVTAKELQSTVQEDDAALWVLLQWHAYHAYVIVIAGWILLFSLWHAGCRFRIRKLEFINRLTRTQRIRSYVPPLGPACAFLCSLALISYLWVLQSRVQSVEAEFQRQMEFARDPSATIAEFQLEIDEFRADKWAMRPVEASVKSEMGRVLE